MALWRLLAGTVMVEGHGIESCHGTAERSQEKVMVLLSVGARAREVMEEWWWFTRFIFRLHQRLQSTFLSHLFLCCFAYKIINCSGYRYIVAYNLATYSQYNIILLIKLEIESYYHDIKHYLLHLLQDFVA